MSLVMIEYVLSGWLWVALIEPTLSYISPGEIACLIIVLSSQVD